MTLRSVPRWYVQLLLSTLVLVASGCDEFPGIDAIGIQRGPGGEIEVVKPLCPGDRVTEVTLIRAPEGHLDDSESGVLWRITSKTGSTRDMYLVGTTPVGFVEEVPLSRVPGVAEGLAATIDSEFDTQALMAFMPSELRSDQVLEPDGYFTPRQFETRHRRVGLTGLSMLEDGVRRRSFLQRSGTSSSPPHPG
jgi:hypothetical protein